MTEESSNLAMAKTVLTTVGSVAATAMIARTMLREILPDEFHDYFYSGIQNLFNRFSNDFTLVIDEFEKLVNNEVYEAAEIYLGGRVTPSTRRLKISKAQRENNLNIRMEKGEEIVDVFNGIKLKWIWIVNKTDRTGNQFHNPRDRNSTLKSEVRCFYLTFHKKHKDAVIDSYLPFLLNQAKLIKHKKKTLTLFTADYNEWTDITLDHPATFDTLAMDSDQKEFILKDLDRFVKRKEHYRKVGKAWKRGYLLYGPPGTGKSSLIAAMANYLNFDIYDLELTAVMSNSDLRMLLVATANKSILVVEDIDCTVELKERAANQDSSSDSIKKSDDEENKVTLSGFLNFIDGLWSSCGDERIIIFTTNHKEKLDPALLRPGRMDVHVHMSYCTPSGFRILAANYLGLKNHPLFEDIEELIRTTEVTPAEVAEQLLQHDDTDATLQGLSDFLHKKKKENEVAKTTKEKEEGVDDGVKEQKAEEKYKEKD